MALSIGPLKVSGYALLGPDSFLIVLSGRFPQPGIQIGFGFAVSGVGGIFGVNRRTDAAALTAAVLDGSLGNLLFPNDPERDMPRILANLPRMFPPQRGQALLGPMFELNWSGGLLKAQAALILEGPDPIKVSSSADWSSTCRTPDLALVHIQATFAAIADFGVPELRIVASLTGSYIVGLTLTGDLFLLIRGGSRFAIRVVGRRFPPRRASARRRARRCSGSAWRWVSAFAEIALRVVLRRHHHQCAVRREGRTARRGGRLRRARLVWVRRTHRMAAPFHFTVGVTAGVEVEVFGETLLGIASGLPGGAVALAPQVPAARWRCFSSRCRSASTRPSATSPAPLTFVPDVAVELVKAALGSRVVDAAATQRRHRRRRAVRRRGGRGGRGHSAAPGGPPAGAPASCSRSE